MYGDFWGGGLLRLLRVAKLEGWLANLEIWVATLEEYGLVRVLVIQGG